MRRFTASYDEDYRNTVVPIPCDDGAIAGALALAFDDGDELRAERAARRELARRLAQQAAVARLGELALRRATLDELMEAACRAVADGLEVELVHLLERAEEPGLMRSAGVGWPDGFVGSSFEVRSFADPATRERFARGPVVIEDLPNDPDWGARPLRAHGEPRFCSTSVGVVVSDPNGSRGPAELLSDADAALYRAKERGRGRHEVFDVGLRDRTTARLRIEADLRRALEAGDQLWVAYQPYYALRDVTVSGVEALLRWDHPERGPIPPAEFIPVAEDSGLIVELGELVLRTACREVARLRAEGTAPELAVSVNISARQMALTGMPGLVGAVLREAGLDPVALALEITEGVLLEDTAATAETLQALRRLGVRLLLDDFGTGYSSLAYLRRHPIDALKIDRAFVADLGEDGEGDAAIVQAIVGMAKALGMQVVPEGVETAGQLRRLTALGCEFAQGYHLSKPHTARDLETLLRGGAR